MQASNGVLIPKTLEDQFRLAKCYAASRILPKHFDSPEKVMAAMQICYEVGLPPLASLRNICVINGVPSFWGDLPLAIVRSSGLLKFIDEYHVDKDGNRICLENKNLGAEVFAAVCLIARQNEAVREFVFTKNDAVAMGKETSPIWKQYKPTMYKRKARAIALKDVFSDLLFGLSIAEYDHHSAPDLDPSIVEVESSKSADLNDKLSIEG